MKNILLVALAGLFFSSCHNDDPELSGDKAITSFTFLASDNPELASDVSATISGEEIHVNLPAGTSLTSLKPTIAHQGNTINPESGTSMDFSAPLNYEVTAHNKTSKNYTVTVTVNLPTPSSEKTITSFSFLKSDNPSLPGDVQGTINGQNIICTVPAGTSITALKPRVMHDGSIVTPNSGTANNFTSPVAYVVIAEDGSEQSYTVTVSVSESGPNVYVTGSQTFFGTRYGTIWKNGTAANLTNGTYNTSANSIFHKDNTLHVVGNQHIGNSVASSWKIENGTQLSTPKLNETVNDSYANSVYVSNNNDIYIAGHEYHGGDVGTIAKVWKNGAPTHLTEKWGVANSVFVSGDDVYVAGWEETSTGSNAIVWKNGVATVLSPEILKSQAFGVFVDGDDVYVAGQYWNVLSQTHIVVVWKNNSAQFITPETNSSEVSSIFVDNGDVYLTGHQKIDDHYKAMLWKNGTGTILSNVNNAEAKSVYVFDDDVYVAGWEPENGKLNAILWKNGEAILLAKDAFASCVIVK